ncbi:emopamil-binding protein [Fusarium fujikuroi]|nr:emopamil-binding protein [Fusarium fujikuroi]
MDTLVESVNATAKIPLHPFWPLNAALPQYAANTLSSRALVASFVVGASAILGVTLSLIQQSRRKLSKTEMFMTLCGANRPGYYVVNFVDISNRQFLFAQLWKEYSLSDSRYLTQDSFLVPMEAITAFLWGPMSFFCAWSIVKQHPLRHPIQLIISVGQLYGDVLYFGTCYFNEIVHSVVYCRPEQFYFYMYYVFCNAIWIVIPTVCVVHSVVQTKRAFAKVQEVERVKKGIANYIHFYLAPFSQLPLLTPTLSDPRWSVEMFTRSFTDQIIPSLRFRLLYEEESKTEPEKAVVHAHSGLTFTIDSESQAHDAFQQVYQLPDERWGTVRLWYQQQAY